MYRLNVLRKYNMIKCIVLFAYVFELLTVVIILLRTMYTSMGVYQRLNYNFPD